MSGPDEPYRPEQPEQYGPPSQQPFPLTAHYEEPAKKGRRGKVLAAAAVVVIVAAGAVVTAVAFRDKGSGVGASSPQSAVKLVVDDLTKSDVLGVLGDLPPAERDALRDSFNDEVTQLKRLNVLTPTADANHVSGVQVAASGLTFDPTDQVINDHVRIVKVTGGTVTISSDASAVPYTEQFINAAFPNGAPTGNQSNTIDITKEVQQSGQPVRIAVEEVGGHWYPSLMYTIVDSVNRADGNAEPTAADAIPAVGAASADAAVQTFINAGLKSDANAAIAILDPTDSAALHDYGKALTQGTTPGTASETIDNVAFADTNVSGGVRVSLRSITVTDRSDGRRSTFAVDGNCIQVSAGNDSHTYCAAEILNLISQTGVLKLTSEQNGAHRPVHRTSQRRGRGHAVRRPVVRKPDSQFRRTRHRRTERADGQRPDRTHPTGQPSALAPPAASSRPCSRRRARSGTRPVAR